MTTTKDISTLLTIGSFSHMAVYTGDQYPCTIDYEISCITGCTTVPSYTLAANSITWNADTSGEFTLELKVFYD